MKTLLPILISGFVLCGFFAVSLSAFLLPKSEPEPDPEPNQTVFYEEPITLYYDFSQRDSELCISVPFFNADISDIRSYKWSFYYFTNGQRRDISIDFSSPTYYVYFSMLSRFFSMQNVYFMVTAVNRSDSTDVYTWYFLYYFRPFPSSGSSSSSRSVFLDDAAVEEVPADQVDAAAEEVPADQVDSAAKEVSADHVDAAAEKNESED